jgi:hypothetical protein
MTELIVHGDAEALIVSVLHDQTPELAPYSARVATDLRGYTAGSRWMMITIEGASMAQWNVLHKPRLDVEVRAERRDVAQKMAQIALASIFRAVGYQYAGAFLSEVKLETGLLNVPDKDEEESYRYIFAIRLTCTVAQDES